MVKKGKCLVVLFVDEVYDLNGNILMGFKWLMEVVEDGGGRLFVVLVGYLKLCNDLCCLMVEEIGYCIDIFILDGIIGS